MIATSRPRRRTIGTLAELLREKMGRPDSYGRLPALMVYQPFGPRRCFEYRAWYAVLGEIWSCCDNIGFFTEELREQLRDAGPMVRHMMTPKERAELNRLGEWVTCYRGCGSKNRLGLSWSLELSIAARFPLYGRYRASDPVLLTARIRKSSIFALKLDRNERELIADVTEPDLTSVRALTDEDNLFSSWEGGCHGAN